MPIKSTPSRSLKTIAAAYTDHLLIVGWVLAVMLGVANYLHRDSLPPHWDMARHLMNSLTYLNNVHLNQDGWRFFGEYYAYYPPLTYILTLPWYHWLGNSMQSAILSNTVWILTLCLSLYGLAKASWGRAVGIISAVAITLVPIFAGQTREFQIDLPLSATTTLALYALVKTNYFKSTAYSLLLGIAIGLGFLTKWTFAAFLLIPCTVTAVYGIWLGYKQKDWRPLGRIALTLVITFLIAGHWYITNKHKLHLDFNANGVSAGATENDPTTFFPSFFWYLSHLLDIQLFLPLTLFSVVGFIFSLLNKDFWRRNWLIMITMVSSLLIFIKLPNKDIRFDMPLFPLLMIIATYWVFQLRGYAKTIGLSLLGLTLALNALLLIFEWPLIDNIDIGQNGNHVIVLSNVGYTSFSPQTHIDSPAAIFTDALKQDLITCPAGLAPRMSFFGAGLERFNPLGFGYYDYQQGNHFSINTDLDPKHNQFMVFFGPLDHIDSQLEPFKAAASLSQIGHYLIPNDQVAFLYKINQNFDPQQCALPPS